MGPCSCLLSSFVIWALLICLNHFIGNSEKEEGENHFSGDRLFLLTDAANEVSRGNSMILSGGIYFIRISEM